jgi:hypothetical protein
MSRSGWNVTALSIATVICSLLLAKRLAFPLLLKLLLNVIFSAVVYLFTVNTIPKCVSSFINAHLAGKDVGKVDRRIL